MGVCVWVHAHVLSIFQINYKQNNDQYAHYAQKKKILDANMQGILMKTVCSNL